MTSPGDRRMIAHGLRRGSRLLTVIAFGFLPVTATSADTATYPDRQIRIISSFPAGTAMDTVARIVGAKLSEAIGQPVVVENRAGASGNIGSEFVARASPDGYTLAIAGVTITMNPGTMGARAVDPVHAFAAITKITTQPVVLVAAPSFAANTLPEFLVLARREPGNIAYTTSGIGTPPHLATALLAARASVDLLHIPYSGSSQGINGMLAPAATPAAIVERLNREFVRIVNLPDVRAKLVAMGSDIVGNTSEAFAAEIRADVARWGPIMEAAGIRRE